MPFSIVVFGKQNLKNCTLEFYRERQRQNINCFNLRREIRISAAVFADFHVQVAFKSSLLYVQEKGEWEVRISAAVLADVRVFVA